MKDDEEFKKALADKQVPILVLDEKWHRLFAVHGCKKQSLQAPCTGRR